MFFNSLIVLVYSKPSLNRPTMGSILSDPFREVGGRLMELELQWVIWDPNKAINIGEWSICGRGWLQRFYCFLKFSASLLLMQTTVPNCQIGKDYNSPTSQIRSTNICCSTVTFKNMKY